MAFPQRVLNSRLNFYIEPFRIFFIISIDQKRKKK